MLLGIMVQSPVGEDKWVGVGRNDHVKRLSLCVCRELHTYPGDELGKDIGWSYARPGTDHH